VADPIIRGLPALPGAKGKAKGERVWLPVFQSFIEQLRIQSKELQATDERGSKLDLWGSQRIYLEQISQGMDDGIRDFYCLKSRQLGVTTVSLAIDLFWLATHPRMMGVLVADNDGNRDFFRKTLQNYHASLPPEFVRGVFEKVKDNEGYMEFSNGARLDFLVAGTRKKTWGEGRGYTLAHVTEVSKYGTPEGISSFKETLAEKNPDRLFMWESTAFGMNHWRDMYEEAERDTFTKRGFFVGWWSKEPNSVDRKDNRFAVFGTEPPNPEEREKIKLVKERHGVIISQEQLAWRRWRDADTSTSKADLDQNQPWLCLARGTRVGTTKGIQRIEDIIPGRYGTCGYISEARSNGTARIYRAVTSLGYEVRGTANHPLIDTEGREVGLGVSQGVTVKLIPPITAEEPHTVRWREGITDCSITVTPDFARLVGIYMGDGSASGSPRSGWVVQIVCSDREECLIAEYVRLFKACFGAEAGVYKKAKKYPNGHVTQTWAAVQCCSRMVVETFKKLGLAEAETTGSTRRAIHVPDFIWMSPKDVIKEFLSGLFETDGFNDFKSDRVVLSSKYKAFLNDVHVLLLAFGITSKLTAVTTSCNGKDFGSYLLTLRASESIAFNEQIGFLSERKRGRFIPVDQRPTPTTKRGQHKIPIAFEDCVVSVTDEGVEEDVFNLTVEDSHLFDANGILTHNCEEAFVQSGYSFFQTRLVTKWLDKIYDPANGIVYLPYRFYLGTVFHECRMDPIPPSEIELKGTDIIELRVWEQPVDGATYVIGFDPAYGRTDWKDRHSLSCWRCFADKMVQVAEYADNRVETYQAAWVLAYLAGVYKDCIINIELTGPGRAVFRELDDKRTEYRAEMNKKHVDDRGWDNFLGAARYYLYHRPDSIGAGYAYHTEMTWSIKGRVLNQFRDAFMTGALEIRSAPLLDEMMTVVQDGSEIAAPGQMKDDRVFAGVLACMAWKDWVQASMIQKGQTYEAVMASENSEPTPVHSFVRHIVHNFWKTRTETLENPPEPPKNFFEQRGM